MGCEYPLRNGSGLADDHQGVGFDTEFLLLLGVSGQEMRGDHFGIIGAEYTLKAISSQQPPMGWLRRSFSMSIPCSSRRSRAATDFAAESSFPNITLSPRKSSILPDPAVLSCDDHPLLKGLAVAVQGAEEAVRLEETRKGNIGVRVLEYEFEISALDAVVEFGSRGRNGHLEFEAGLRP